MGKIRILIAGGGTGGHLFPGLAIAEQIREIHKDAEIRFVGTARGIETGIVPQSGYRLYLLPVSGLYRVGFIKKILSLFKLPFALLKSLFILLTFNPHVVIGVGGYISGPVLAMAILCLKKTVIQEQNASPGLTNRLLGKLVSMVFVPFSGMEGYFKRPFIVGNPVRKAILDLADRPDTREKDTFQITLFGGSQGASILNKTMVATLPLLQEYYPQLSILHQTGKMQCESVQEQYKAYPVKAEVLPFINDMAEAYHSSNLLICRAGSSITEIIAAGRASIVVPISQSSGDHQLKNAVVLQQNQAGILIEEKELTPQLLAQNIISLIENRERLAQMEKNAKSLFAGNAAKTIAKKITEMI